MNRLLGWTVIVACIAAIPGCDGRGATQSPRQWPHVCVFRVATSDEISDSTIEACRQALVDEDFAELQNQDLIWLKLRDLKMLLPPDSEKKSKSQQPLDERAARALDTILATNNEQHYVLFHSDSDSKLCFQGKNGSYISGAVRSADYLGRPAMEFAVKSEFQSNLGAFTRLNQGKRIGVVVDQEVWSLPTIQSEIRERCMITGAFERREFEKLMDKFWK